MLAQLRQSVRLEPELTAEATERLIAPSTVALKIYRSAPRAHCSSTSILMTHHFDGIAQLGSNSAGSGPKARIEGIPQTFTQKIESRHGDEDCCTGE